MPNDTLARLTPARAPSIAMADNDDEARRKLEKPQCSAEAVVEFVRANFVLPCGGEVDASSAKELNSYDDRNFHVRATSGAEYTLKVHNGVESQNQPLLDAQSAMMRHLTASGVKCPCPVVGVDGHDIARMNLPLRQGARDARRDHAVRVLTWVDGSIADDCRDAHTPAFMRELGAFLGRMVRALESFSHPGAERWHQWDNANALTVRKFMDAVEDPARRAIAEGVLDDFEAKVIPMAGSLRRGATHNDANEQNVIVRLETSGECAGPFRATPVGIIDFGDINVSWRVNDVAIACAYYTLNKRDPVGDAARCLAGFETEFPLTDAERSIVPTLMAARLVVSCVLGAYSAARDPANKEYLLTTQKPGWEVLGALRAAGDEEILRRFAAARCKQ